MRLTGRAVIVCGAMVVLAVPACRPAPPSGRDALAAAVSTTLPFSARLSGGFAPSAQGPTRAAAPPALSPDTRIAIAELEKRAAASPTPEALADLGVAYLVQGDVDRAITTIEDAALQLRAAAPWSDLSAAYLVKAERTPARRVEHLARALEAAETSLKISPSNPARFNRALARDGLAPYTGVPAPWPEFVAAEGDPAWRQAAAREAANDRAIDDVRDLWEARRQALPSKLAARDASFVKETVSLYPEASIEFLEHELLTDDQALPAATLLASTLQEVTRDPMMRDEVAALRLHGEALARAHRSYSTAVTRFDANDQAGARRLFGEALAGFARAGAPYRLWAQMQIARTDWQEGRLDAAGRALAAVERQARDRGYQTLLGRVLWQQGLVFTRQWRLTEALAAFRAAAGCYEGAAQRENALSIYSNLADTLRMLGEPHESWAFIGRTLEELPRVRKPLRRYLLLYNASLFASRQDLHEAALLFQDATVRQATAASPDVHTEALVQRALIHLRRGDEAGARADLELASRQAQSGPSPAFREYINAELAIVRSQLGGPAAGLKDAIAFFSRTEPGRVPGLYLLLARTPEARQSRAAAEEALRLGIDSLEGQQARLDDETLRISFFDESWTLFQDMVALQLAAKDTAKVFEYAERSRARALLAAAQGAPASRTRLLPDIQGALPAGVTMVHYSTLPDRVLIWTIGAAGATLAERPIDERELARLVHQHRESIGDGREGAAGERLYRLLIDPIAPWPAPESVVVLVPDGPLQQLPFATLRHPTTRRYLIEDHALMVSPSATFFVDARAGAAGRVRPPLASALLVGNPAAGGAVALPGAEAEVERAASFYGRHELLVGRAATKDRFLELAPAFDVVHFGGHAFANAEFPLLSRLVFADVAEREQSLFAHEIARLRFPRTRVVVLAACSTAAGAVSRGEGVVSVARPFLGGGVPLVIASQWDVDDRATAELTLIFHRELAASRDAIRALQTAQLALLRSGDAVQASPESWGAFVAVGTAAP